MAEYPYQQYVSGSSALARRNISVLPDIEHERLDRKEEQRHIREAKQTIDQRVRQRRASAREFSVGQIFIVAAVVAFAVVLCVSFLRMESQFSDSTIKLRQLERQYSALVSQNNILEEQNTQDIPYNEIYKYATDVLGMQLPQQHQVVRYEREETEYVNKNGQIPTE